jgi:DNA mismatch repair protein MutS2
MIFDKVIDLHDINPLHLNFELEKFLMHSYLEGDKKVKIITGKGEGVLSKRVIKILKNSKIIKRVETPLWGHGDEGAIAVWLLDC